MGVWGGRVMRARSHGMCMDGGTHTPVAGRELLARLQVDECAQNATDPVVTVDVVANIPDAAAVVADVADGGPVAAAAGVTARGNIVPISGEPVGIGPARM